MYMEHSDQTVTVGMHIHKPAVFADTGIFIRTVGYLHFADISF